MPRLVIIGGGISGASMFYHMRELYPDWEVLLLEKGDAVGGINRTIEIAGLRFALGSRYIFGLNDYTVDLVTKLAGGECKRGESVHSVFYKGKYLDFPIQANISGLPFWDRVRCLLGVMGRKFHKKDVKTFEEWALRSFGSGLANRFLLPHNYKCWRVDPSEIDYRGTAQKVTFPRIGDMVVGAVRGKGHKNDEFLYPEGGIGRIIEKMAYGDGTDYEWGKVMAGSMVHAVGMSEKIVTYGPVMDLRKKQELGYALNTVEYDAIVSTIPLPGLINLIVNSNVGVFDEVVLAGEQLRFNCMASIMLVFDGNFLKNRPEHFVYVPEKKYRFSRVSFPSNFDDTNVSDNYSALMVEVSFNKEQKKLLFRKDYQEKLVNRIISELEDLFINAIGFPYNLKNSLAEYRVGIIDPAYIITDENYQSATRILNMWLTQHRIHSLGRFAKWDWSRIEDTLPESRDLAHIIGGKPWKVKH